MGIAIDEIGIETHHLQQLLHALPSLSAAGDVVHLQRFADDVPHGHAGVKRGIRILEDHLHLAAHAAQLLALDVRQFQIFAFVSEEDPTGSRPVELENGSASRGLAAAALAHQPQGLAPADEEINAIHRLDVTYVALNDDPLGDGEIHLQSFDSKQDIVAHSTALLPSAHPPSRRSDALALLAPAAGFPPNNDQF